MAARNENVTTFIRINESRWARRYNRSMGTSQGLARLFRAGFIATTTLIAVFSVSAQSELNPHPAKPAELLAAIDRADKLVVYDFDVEAEKNDQTTLYSSVKRKDISELKQSLVMEQPTEWFRCACLPMLEIKLSRNGLEIGVISVFDDLTIEFSGWSGDVRLADQEKLLGWFDVREIPGPRHAIEEQQASERADRIVADRWLAAMPPDLRALWPQVVKNPQWWGNPPEAVNASAKFLDPALVNEYPDVKQRIGSLFSWFGSGSGHWSGYYAWEDVPAHMLLEYSASELVSALQEQPLTDAEAEGAVRFFVGYTPDAWVRPPGNTTLIAQLPDELKKELFDHLAKTGDQDKLNWARKAFQKPYN